MIKAFWTDKQGNMCVAKLQNSIVWLITVVKLLLGGLTVGGVTFEPLTMDAMAPYLTLLGVTSTNYVVRNHSKKPKRRTDPLPDVISGSQMPPVVSPYSERETK
jgi:hypothetical protein